MKGGTVAPGSREGNEPATHFPASPKRIASSQFVSDLQAWTFRGISFQLVIFKSSSDKLEAYPTSFFTASPLMIERCQTVILRG